MTLSRRALALVCAMLLLNSVAWAARPGDDDDDDLSTEECELLHQMKAPTIYGGTGLFNTYTTRTHNKGEWTVGFFWNNMDREPGDIDINQIPINFTWGLTDRWEIWVFLYPLDRSSRYIKRVVGMPGEELKIQNGDIFVRNSVKEDFRIVRKPARVQRANLGGERWLGSRHRDVGRDSIDRERRKHARRGSPFATPGPQLIAA